MIDDSMSILKFIIPKAHICFYICSEIKYYLKKNYLYYYFIILFLEFANCFQLFISSIPIYIYIFNLDERHSLKATVLESGKKCINWVSVGTFETLS